VWTPRNGEFSGAHGWAGQGCGELETSRDAGSLGQGLTALCGGGRIDKVVEPLGAGKGRSGLSVR